jgi:hypothetical protein
MQGAGSVNIDWLHENDLRAQIANAVSADVRNRKW